MIFVTASGRRAHDPTVLINSGSSVKAGSSHGFGLGSSMSGSSDDDFTGSPGTIRF